MRIAIIVSVVCLLAFTMYKGALDIAQYNVSRAIPQAAFSINPACKVVQSEITKTDEDGTVKTELEDICE